MRKYNTYRSVKYKKKKNKKTHNIMYNVMQIKKQKKLNKKILHCNVLNMDEEEGILFGN